MDRQYLKEKVSHLGVAGASLHYAGRALLRLGELEAYRVLRLTPDDARADPREPTADPPCSRVSPDCLRRAAEDPATGVTREQLEEALARGEECYGAFIGPVLASHAWYSRGAAHLRGDVFVKVAREWVYSRWAFTRPEYRGLRLHAAVKRYALGVAVREGRRGVLSLVAATNLESLHGGAHAGCRAVGLLVTARVAGRRLTWMSAGCRSHGFQVMVVPELKLTSS